MLVSRYGDAGVGKCTDKMACCLLQCNQGAANFFLSFCAPYGLKVEVWSFNQKAAGSPARSSLARGEDHQAALLGSFFP
jgi:hypothetical protein